MLSKLKKWGIYAIVFICIGGGIFILGYMVHGWTTPTITIGQGAIVEKTNVIYKPIPVSGTGGCADIVARFNSLLNDYNAFISAVPEAYNVTPEKIYFKLYTQKYSLDYKYTPREQWTISPQIAVKVSRDGIAYGGGMGADYVNVWASVLLFSDISLVASAGYRIKL